MTWPSLLLLLPLLHSVTALTVERLARAETPASPLMLVPLHYSGKYIFAFKCMQSECWVCLVLSKQIPKNDPRFGNNSENECIPFTRSAPACGSGNTGFNFGASTVREQMNTLTAFLDAGEVYGSDEVKARSLRDLTSDKGLLRVNDIFNDTGRELMPFSSMSTNMCATRARITNTSNVVEVPCFFAGEYHQIHWLSNL